LCVIVGRYFKDGEQGEGDDEKADVYHWWHKKLADYFETVDNTDRLVEVRTLVLRFDLSFEFYLILYYGSDILVYFSYPGALEQGE
jgi:hypothetical protein